MRLRPIPTLLALAVSSPATAGAGGYYIGDIGTRGNARGGAYVARADSLVGIHYNPAGLSLIKGLHLQTDMTFVGFDYEFDRDCPCLGDAEVDKRLKEGFDGRTSANQGPVQYIPFLSLGYGFDFLDLTIAAAVYGPHSPRSWSFGKFGELSTGRQPQRYSSISAELFELYYALAVALSPIDGLRIGGSVILYSFATKQQLNLWANTSAAQPGSVESTDFDVGAEFDVSQPLGLSWSLGAAYDILDYLTIGVSVTGKRSVRATGAARIVPSPNFGVRLDVESADEANNLSIEVNLPPIFRGGLEFHLEDILRVEAAVVVEAWEIYKSAVIRGQNLDIVTDVGSQGLGTIELPFNFKTTYSLRLGGEVNLFEPWLGLRAGYFYEPSAIPTEFKDVSTPDLDKHGMSLGLATTWWGITLSLTGQYILFDSLTVTTSERELTAPLQDGPTEFNTVVGNGTYRASAFFVGAGLSFSLDSYFGGEEEDEAKKDEEG